MAMGPKEPRKEAQRWGGRGGAIAILRRSAQKYRKYVGTVSVIAVYEHDRGTEGSADLRERHRGCRHYLIRRSRF